MWARIRGTNRLELKWGKIITYPHRSVKIVSVMFKALQGWNLLSIILQFTFNSFHCLSPPPPLMQQLNAVAEPETRWNTLAVPSECKRIVLPNCNIKGVRSPVTCDLFSKCVSAIWIKRKEWVITAWSPKRGCERCIIDSKLVWLWKICQHKCLFSSLVMSQSVSRV